MPVRSLRWSSTFWPVSSPGATTSATSPRMRKEYRDRRSATISAFRASPLASHVTFFRGGGRSALSAAAGYQPPDEELRRLTAEAGIRLSFLSEYAAVPDPRFAHTLVINYAGLSQSDLEEALQLLTDVLLPLLA